MKKQSKTIAAFSAAALLAVGMSAVSFAAGWDNSTGNWQWINSDGSTATDCWKSANGSWFYLGDDGNMVTNALIEDTSGSKTKYYYVDENGAMVKNAWKAVAMDGNENTDIEAEYWWYYFGSDGRAYTTNNDKSQLTKSNLKTINGLKYAFDAEGHMLYGWISDSGLDQQDGDDQAWKTSKWYANGWNDGHLATGWVQLTVEDNENNDSTTQTYWFNFDSNGQKQAGKRKKINGVWYRFAEDGHMLTGWAQSASEAIDENHKVDDKDKASSSIVFLSSSGAERKNQWVYAVPAEDWIKKDNEDNEYSWFYFNKSGKRAQNEIKKINGKHYAFDNVGRMQTGLVVVADAVDEEGKKVVSRLLKDDNGMPRVNLNFNDVLDKDKEKKPDAFTREAILKRDLFHSTVYALYEKTSHDYTDDLNMELYYFDVNDSVGSRKHGYVNIELEDGTYQFYFDPSAKRVVTNDRNTERLKKFSGYVSKIKKFVVNGLVLKAWDDYGFDTDYAIVRATAYNPYSTTSAYEIWFQKWNGEYLPPIESINVDVLFNYNSARYIDEAAYPGAVDVLYQKHILINKSGNIMRNKTIKDSNDMYYLTTKSGCLYMIAPNKEVYDKLKKDGKWKVDENKWPVY